MDDMTQAYTILGSNLGRRAEQLRRAAFLLGGTPGVELTRASHLYQTPPWGTQPDQPDYLNAAVEFQTRLEPEPLLDRLQEIERLLGRQRDGERWGPRLIDLDLALFGQQVIQTPRLEVPHPRLAERAFALLPLLEIAPDLKRPRTIPDSPENPESWNACLERIPPSERATCRRIEPLLWTVEDGGTAFERMRETDNSSQEPPSFLFLSRSSDETEALGKQLGASLRGGEVFALSGNLGAGKTCLARGLARGLGIHETVTSPSYVLVKSYEGRFALHHADFYRLEATLGSGSPAGNAPAERADLASLGLEDYLDDPQAVLLIEWAEHRPCWLEPPFWQVEITGCGDGPRLLLLRQIGNRRSRD
jgi:2-amino-4-hydroxy-6-hydroxymethyldihydropteridine diphosphokinase